jgi:putative photosynthetic complex assembly protein 2
VWDYALPIVYSLFVWWFSTGAVLYLVGTVGEGSRPAIVGAGALFAASLVGLAATRADTSVAGAYLAFTAALLVWGAQEIAFLTGWITGPWRNPCPAGATGWRRTGYAVGAILYHEIALALSGLAVVAVTWGGANQVGAWTFAVLFGMRISAKLNVFLGVPNITENFLPPHLAHLKSFFGRAPMNLLFPVAVTISTVLATLLVSEAAAAVDPFRAAAMTFLATLVALALLEHWFLVLPLPVEALWTWGLRARDEGAPGTSDATEIGATEDMKVVRLERAQAGHRGGPGALSPVAAPQTFLSAGPGAQVIAQRFDKGGGRS